MIPCRDKMIRQSANLPYKTTDVIICNPLTKMDLQQFNALFLRVIELIISMLAYAIAITGGLTVITSRILIAGSLKVQIQSCCHIIFRNRLIITI